ncbi:MAG TPA: SRPBCC family protein [Thermoanaerobaculia bacterium]|nr:SRPBCC family protein [Thermoanaerobaculia bacterium]
MTLTWRHRFEVDADVEQVADFHRRPESLKKLTPGLLFLRFLEPPPAELNPGDELRFRLFASVIPVDWRARIEELESTAPNVFGFQDRQLEGPFERWVHRHRFVDLGGGRTAIEDEIEARFRRHLVWGPVGWQMWVGLPLGWMYRVRQTRRALEVD